MPISYHIDVARRIVLTRGEGIVTNEDLLQHNRNLKSDPNFDPSFNQLSDFTNAIVNEIKGETIHRVAAEPVFNPSSLRALVVTQGLQFGLARMFQIIREVDDQNIQVFVDVSEARKWLGLDV